MLIDPESVAIVPIPGRASILSFSSSLTFHTINGDAAIPFKIVALVGSVSVLDGDGAVTPKVSCTFT
jgi:hypothetical protein